MGKRYYKSKSEQKRVEAQTAPTSDNPFVSDDYKAKLQDIPELKFEYSCPRCTRVAIQTSNKMIGVTVPCSSCGEMITLDDETRYREIAK